MTEYRTGRAMTLLLIRHGETAWNAEGRFRGHADIDLSARGRQQAAELARRLPRCFPIEHIYSSPLKRSLETARPLPKALGLSVVVEPALIDLDFGEWQGKLSEEVARKFPEEYAAWLSGDLAVQFPNGERLQAAVERLRGFIHDVSELHADEVVAAVTHEAVCQLANRLLTGAPLSSFRLVRHDPGHASIFERQGRGKWSGV